jgi:hypothetical protein
VKVPHPGPTVLSLQCGRGAEDRLPRRWRYLVQIAGGVCWAFTNRHAMATYYMAVEDACGRDAIEFWRDRFPRARIRS